MGGRLVGFVLLWIVVSGVLQSAIGSALVLFFGIPWVLKGGSGGCR